jgi:ABC-2 type transport system ATP-binding protein
VNAGYALETEWLGKRSGRLWALRGCDLALPSGRVIALVGPNGAGKTTLLRLVAGLVTPTEGKVAILGTPSTPDTRQTLAKIGFLAQNHPLYSLKRAPCCAPPAPLGGPR